MTTKAALKIKKKRWVPIFGPKLFADTLLGETYISDISEAQGRHITVSMMQLTNDPKRQSINATFTINGQKEGGLAADFIGIQILPSALKRLVRRNKEKIDDSFSVTTKDKKLIRIKPIIITRGHITSATLRDIRLCMRNVIAWEASTSSYDKICGDLLDRNIQRAVYEACTPIYPLSACEIREFKYLGEATTPNKPGILIPPTQQPFIPKPKKTTETTTTETTEITQETPAQTQPQNSST